MQQEYGRVDNPITFLSADMLRLLGQTPSGTNFKDIDEWLDRLWSTSIISEGMVYYAGRKIRVKDRTPIKVFTRAVTAGGALDDGAIAEKNYVWLSDWQLENVNNNYQFPIDFEGYKKLKNNIAKTLAPLLQIWLYATRKKGSFEKRYDELSQLLDTTQYKHASKIIEKLGPSLDELQRHGYLASWRIEKTSDGRGFKIVFIHGPKFHRDQRRRITGEGCEPAPLLEAPAAAEDLAESSRPDQLAELIRRGVGERGARKLLAKLPPERPVKDLIEWGDQEIARQPGKITNPAGFYIRLLEEHSAPPPTFESSQAKKARQELEIERQRKLADEREAALWQEQAGHEQTEAQLAALPPEQYQALFEQAKTELFEQYPFMAKQPDGSAIHEGAIRARMKQRLAAAP